MDRINIVSSQAVLEMFSFTMDTCLMSSSPLVNSLVKNRLFKTVPDIDKPPFQFFHTVDLSGRHNAAWLLISHNPQDWDLFCLETTAWMQESLAFLDAAVQLLHVLGAVCWCTVLLEQSHYQTLLIAGSSMTSLWRCEAADSKRYHQNFLLCIQWNYCMHCRFIQQFCEEVYAFAFFKVVQQQTVGKVGNSSMCLWADNVCLQQWKNY